MGNFIKDWLLKAAREVKKEYTRVDRTCNNCFREIFGGEGIGESLFCPDCYAHLPFNGKSICAHCGRSTLEPVKFCDDCTGIEWTYHSARSPFYYAMPVDKLIRAQKYGGRRYLAEVFSPFLAETFLKSFSEADALVFVPMTKKAIKKRGYNQSELLARQLSKRVGLPVLDVMEKKADTTRQAKLTRSERLMNLKGIFSVTDKAAVRDKRVVVVDDVLTTGATAESMAYSLKKAGAKCIYVLTVASVTDPKTAKLLGQELSYTLKKKEKDRLRRQKRRERQLRRDRRAQKE